MKGESVTNPCESIRLFALCSAMEWTALPVAGGLYDQHPQLVDEWLHIFARRGAHEERKRKEQEQKQKRDSASRGRKSGRRMRG